VVGDKPSFSCAHAVDGGTPKTTAWLVIGDRSDKERCMKRGEEAGKASRIFLSFFGKGIGRLGDQRT